MLICKLIYLCIQDLPVCCKDAALQVQISCLLIPGSWVKTLDLKIQCWFQITSDNANVHKTIISNLVYWPDSFMGISPSESFYPRAHLMSSSYKFFLYYVLSSGIFGANFTVGVVQSQLATSPWAMMKWPCVMSPLHPVGPGSNQLNQPSSVACWHVTIYYQFIVTSSY